MEIDSPGYTIYTPGSHALVVFFIDSSGYDTLGEIDSPEYHTPGRLTHRDIMPREIENLNNAANSEPKSKIF